MYAILSILLLTDAAIVCTVVMGMTRDITAGIASAYIIAALVLVQGAFCVFGWIRARHHDRAPWGLLFKVHAVLSVVILVLAETGLIYDFVQGLG